MKKYTTELGCWNCGEHIEVTCGKWEMLGDEYVCPDCGSKNFLSYEDWWNEGMEEEIGVWTLEQS